MERERFIEIMKDETIKIIFPDRDSAVAGLEIIVKYCPKKGIQAAEHDIIYSVGIDEICETEITEEEVRQLREWNWIYDEDTDGLACFV